MLSTLPSWGPTFRVSFDLYINSFDKGNLDGFAWAEILRFTSTSTSCCSIGDRVPAIFTNKISSTLTIVTQIGPEGHSAKNVKVKKKVWHHLDLLQYPQTSNGKKAVSFSLLHNHTCFIYKANMRHI